MTYCHQFHTNVKSQVSIFQSKETHVPGLGSSRVLGPQGSCVFKGLGSSRVHPESWFLVLWYAVNKFTELNKRINTEAAAHLCSAAVLKNQKQSLADVL